MSNDNSTNSPKDDATMNFGYPGNDVNDQVSSGNNDNGSLDQNAPGVDLGSDQASPSPDPASNNSKNSKPDDLDAQLSNTTPPQSVPTIDKDNSIATDNSAQNVAPTTLGEGEVKAESESGSSPLKALASRLSSIKGGLVETVDESPQGDSAAVTSESDNSKPTDKPKDIVDGLPPMETPSDQKPNVGSVADAPTETTPVVSTLTSTSPVEESTKNDAEEDSAPVEPYKIETPLPEASKVSESVSSPNLNDTFDPLASTVAPVDNTISENLDQMKASEINTLEQPQVDMKTENPESATNDSNNKDSDETSELDISAPTPLTDQLVGNDSPDMAGTSIPDQPIVQIDPDLNDTGGKSMVAPIEDKEEELLPGQEVEESKKEENPEPTPVITDTLPDAPSSNESVDVANEITPGQNMPFSPMEKVVPVSSIIEEADSIDPITVGVEKPKVVHSRYPYTIEQLLDIVVEKDASDLHITVGYPAMIRVDGAMMNVLEEVVTEKQAMDLILPVLPEQKKELLDVNREVDLAYAHREDARFRINAYYQKQTLAGAFRLIPNRIRSIDELNLPPIYHQLTKLKQGLVLVTGPTGSGKSTTLAGILQEINETRPDHIITIEDPVEYILPKARAMVDQRELHEDTHSWEIAMRSALRQDPDVVLVGEMRDYETISAAITLAETGHLVFATLHTNSASQTLDRIVDVFPEHQQAQVRSQLSNTIEAVIAQRLIPIQRGGRVAVSEIMIATPAIRNLIREAKTHQIDNVIRTSADIGMISLEHTLVKMVRDNTITMERAQEFAVHPEEVVRLLKS